MSLDKIRSKIQEARGRPRKDGSSSDDEHEANQNILTQLRKAMDNPNHKVPFKNGQSATVKHPHMVHNSLMRLKPQDRLKMMHHVQQSPKHYAAVHSIVHKNYKG